MARNHNFYFDVDRTPRARGPAAEKMLMAFLESDVQGSDHICRDLMDDLIAIEDGTDDEREFVGNAHRVLIRTDVVRIEALHDESGHTLTPAPADNAQAGTTDDGSTSGSAASNDAASATPGAAKGAAPETSRPEPALYETGPKHFREVLEDWEAFILDDGTDDLADDSLLDDEFV